MSYHFTFAMLHLDSLAALTPLAPLDFGGNIRKNFYSWGSKNSICSKHLENWYNYERRTLLIC